MASITLHPYGTNLTHDRASTSSSSADSDHLPAFWGSLINRDPADHSVPSAAPAPRALKSTAIVGDLWIQIR